jgi:hypothetical protein
MAGNALPQLNVRFHYYRHCNRSFCKNPIYLSYCGAYLICDFCVLSILLGYDAKFTHPLPGNTPLTPRNNALCFPSVLSSLKMGFYVPQKV